MGGCLLHSRASPNLMDTKLRVWNSEKSSCDSGGHQPLIKNPFRLEDTGRESRKSHGPQGLCFMLPIIQQVLYLLHKLRLLPNIPSGAQTPRLILQPSSNLDASLPCQFVISSPCLSVSPPHTHQHSPRHVSPVRSQWCWTQACTPSLCRCVTLGTSLTSLSFKF